MSNKKKLKDLCFAFDGKIRNALDKTAFTHAVYAHVILPLESGIFRAGNYKMSSAFRRALSKVRELYYTEEERNNPKLSKKIEKDLVKTLIAHRMNPEEYFLYGVRDKDYWGRKEFLSDIELHELILKHVPRSTYMGIYHKKAFYTDTKEFFHRDICFIDKESPKSTFVEFATKHQTFFAKPVDGTWGKGASILSVENADEASKIYDELFKENEWIVEELIQQVPETAVWNDTSVNTIRIPAFRTTEGCKILQPFIRTGRKGAIVDNAGGGGIFAVFDADTGVITTDGVDEHGGRYTCHPDSGIRYKGWQVPRYEELKVTVAKLIHAIPSQPRYVAFDFALTNEGWVVVEGNSNGQFVGQIAEHKGVRKEFVKYFVGNK